MIEEIVDLVDEQDQIIAQLSRKEVYRQRLHNYRVIHGFLVNKEGKLWIPRRCPEKKLYPNALDYSLAGHVTSGETYEESLQRETWEELNIDLKTTPWRVLGKRTPSEGAHCFQMLYEIQSDVTPLFNPKDFSEAQWISPKEAIAMIESEASAKDELASVIRRFYL